MGSGGGGKRKGPFATEQPKSREETPKVGCNASGKTASAARLIWASSVCFAMGSGPFSTVCGVIATRDAIVALNTVA